MGLPVPVFRLSGFFYLLTVLVERPLPAMKLVCVYQHTASWENKYDIPRPLNLYTLIRVAACRRPGTL